MPDGESYGRLGMRVRRGEAIDLPEITEPILEPRSVGTLDVMAPGGGDQEHMAMLIEVEPSSLPRLEEAFQAAHGEREIDTTTQWQTLVPDDVRLTPLVLLSVQLPEFDVSFVIVLPLDAYKRSLVTAARTGRVVFAEPALVDALRTRPALEAMQDYRSIGVTVADAEPLRRILQQRFELPLQTVATPPLLVPAEENRAGFRRFCMDANSPEGVALVTSPETGAIVVIVDPGAFEKLSIAAPESELWASWASLQAGPYSLVRLDAISGERALTSIDQRLHAWLIADPPSQLVRAASSGPHAIAVLAAVQSEDSLSRSELAEAVWLPVLDSFEAMRALLRE